MKKLISLVLTLCMAAAMSATVFAVTVDQDDANPADTDVIVSTSVTPAYIVSIPANTTVDYNATSTAFGTIKAESIRRNPLMKVVVSVSSNLALKNASDSRATIPYTITSNDAPFTTIDLLATGDSADLKINITAAAWAAAYAGNYSDTVTFTVSYTAISPVT